MQLHRLSAADVVLPQIFQGLFKRRQYWLWEDPWDDLMGAIHWVLFPELFSVNVSHSAVFIEL